VSLGQLLAGRPPQPPYLTQRPSAPVVIGSVRSLFVDDLLLANRSAPRVYHQAVFKAVVLKPTPSEWVSEHKTNPAFELAWVGRARPYSGGAWFDRREKLYKLFYSCRWSKGKCCGNGMACIALSRDGISFWRPKLAGNGVNTLPNRLQLPVEPDSFTVALDETAGFGSRWKMMVRVSTGEPALLCTSKEGYKWQCNHKSGPITDRASFFFNPYSSAWAFSVRHNGCGLHGATNLTDSQGVPLRHWPGVGARMARYAESKRFAAASWPSYQHNRYYCGEMRQPGEPVWNMAADEHSCGGDSCALYQLDATAYESIVVGQLAMIWGNNHSRNYSEFLGHCKDTRITLGYSRDGFHWTQPDPPRESPFQRQLKYEQPVAGNFLLSPDRTQLYVYHGGARYCKLCNTGGRPRKHEIVGICQATRDGTKKNVTRKQSAMQEVTYVSTLRRDGFCSLRAGREREEQVTTRLLTFRRRTLYVNARCNATGYVQAALLDADWREVAGFRRNESVRVGGDSLQSALRWTTEANLPGPDEPGVRLAFFFRACELYSFWAGGGPEAAGRGGRGA
jgi:hypothetical protein